MNVLYVRKQDNFEKMGRFLQDIESRLSELEVCLVFVETIWWLFLVYMIAMFAMCIDILLVYDEIGRVPF